MVSWFKALFQDLAGRSPIEQLELLKRIGVFGLIGALLFGGYSYVSSKDTDSNDGSEKFTMRAVIKDPDGFTYVRSMPNREGQIVTKVKDKEVFFTYVQSGSWWQVKTGNNRYGYMHVSRIQPLD
jgi:hypothetical protein